MAQWIDLVKKQMLEIHGNDMILTVSLGDNDDDDEIHVRIESKEGGREIGIRPHDEDDQIVVFYLKDSQKKPRFRIV